MNTSDLIARECIRELVARYNRSGDSGQFDDFVECFAADATLELAEGGTSILYEGHAGLRSMLAKARDDFIEDAAVRMGMVYLRHYTSTHVISLIDARHARGRAYFNVVRSWGLDHWGTYVDEYADLEDRWVITRRKIMIEGRVAS
jgi:hypothetical protein